MISYVGMTPGVLRRGCLLSRRLRGPYSAPLIGELLAADNHGIDERIVEMATTHHDTLSGLVHLARIGLGMAANAHDVQERLRFELDFGWQFPAASVKTYLSRTPVLAPLFGETVPVNDENLVNGLLLIVETFGRTPTQYVAMAAAYADRATAAQMDADACIGLTNAWKSEHASVLQELSELIHMTVQIDNQHGTDAALQFMRSGFKARISVACARLIGRQGSPLAPLVTGNEPTQELLWLLRDLMLGPRPFGHPHA